jgi:hypothetical protein
MNGAFGFMLERASKLMFLWAFNASNMAHLLSSSAASLPCLLPAFA